MAIAVTVNPPAIWSCSVCSIPISGRSDSGLVVSHHFTVASKRTHVRHQ
jgi:hypothetical protein